MTNEQHTSRRYINLDWADVEAWVKSRPRTERNRYGGYYTSCPVPEHKTNDRIGVWKDDDGIHLKCYGGCTELDILKEIKPGTAPDTEDTEPPSVTKPRIEALEEEWYSPEAQLALDKLIDERFANEQTAEYWENQATDAETKRKQEHDARIAAETQRDQERAAREAAETERDKAHGDREELQAKAQEKLDKLRNDYRSVKGKLSRRNKKIEGLSVLLETAEAERDKERAARKELEEELPVSKSEVIKDAWSLLDQVPNAAIKEAWTRLETELYQALRHTLKVPGSRPKIQVLLNNAKNEKYINSEQFLHLLVIYDQRNKTTHPDEITRTTLQLTKPEARAALAYLEQVIDKLGPAKASSQDLKRLKAHLNEGR